MKAMIRWTLLLSVMAAVMVILAQPAAAEEELEMRWDIQADLTGEAPDINLIVELGVYDGKGRWKQLDTTTERLACKVDNVAFTGKGEPAFFNGKGYIACEMLNVVDIASAMSGGLAFSRWTGGNGSTVDADAAVQGIWADNPVFYHPDIQFNTPIGTDAAFLSLEVGGLTAKTDYFAVGFMQSLHGELGKSNDPRQHFPIFSVDATSLNASPTVLAGAAAIDQEYTGAIYIGYSPETDSYFEGHIYTIDVDPGCAGVG